MGVVMMWFDLRKQLWGVVPILILLGAIGYMVYFFGFKDHREGEPPIRFEDFYHPNMVKIVDGDESKCYDTYKPYEWRRVPCEEE